MPYKLLSYFARFTTTNFLFYFYLHLIVIFIFNQFFYFILQMALSKHVFHARDLWIDFTNSHWLSIVYQYEEVCMRLGWIYGIFFLKI